MFRHKTFSEQIEEKIAKIKKKEELEHTKEIERNNRIRNVVGKHFKLAANIAGDRLTIKEAHVHMYYFYFQDVHGRFHTIYIFHSSSTTLDASDDKWEITLYSAAYREEIRKVIPEEIELEQLSTILIKWCEIITTDQLKNEY